MTPRLAFIELVKVGLAHSVIGADDAIQFLAPLFRTELDAMFGPGMDVKDLAAKAKEYVEWACGDRDDCWAENFMNQFEINPTAQE